MNGILCINKPKDFTSFDVVAKIRGMSKTKRVGHSGTLDPLATGVLPLFIGNATKACDMMPSDDKSYVASFRLGMTTDTLDISGEVLSETVSAVKKEELLPLIEKYTGEIMQIPPMYSAVRVNGQRLYDIARQGREIEREPRKVTVFKLNLLEFDEKLQSGKLYIECSKGTYIRTIISDIGEDLSVGGIMTELVRTKAGVFTLDDCITMEEAQRLTDEGTLEAHIIPPDRMFYDKPKIVLNESQSRMFLNGVRLDLNRVKYKDIDDLHRVYTNEKRFVGLASLDKEKMELRIEKMFL